MNKIIIGSTALANWFPNANIKPKDLDYAVPLCDKSTREVEYLYNPILFKEEYKEYISDTGFRSSYSRMLIASPDMLYTLKISHMFWDISWSKNIYYIQLMKDLGCKVIKPLFYDLYNFWNEYHGKNKRSNLDMTADEFFNNAVKFPIPHDDLHELLIQHPYFKNQDKPTYSKILIGEVDVCMDKFNELPEQDKINVVFEEVCVMAAERCGSMNYRQAYDIMLKKFIMSHCKLEEGIWILDNFQLVRKPPFNYVEFLNSKIKELCN